MVIQRDVALSQRQTMESTRKIKFVALPMADRKVSSRRMEVSGLLHPSSWESIDVVLSIVMQYKHEENVLNSL